MSRTNKAREISLGEGLGELVVHANGTRVDIYGEADVIAHRRSAETVSSMPPRAMQVGDMMMDGTIYAGVSPDTNRPMYAAPGDSPLTMTWQHAMHYATTLAKHGIHKDWRVPTDAELNVLFNNRAAIGGFDTSVSSMDAGWYWSSTEEDDMEDRALAQSFSGGSTSWDKKALASSVRLVRG